MVYQEICSDNSIASKREREIEGLRKEEKLFLIKYAN
jgi:predicted GIY-YIG superfamily endonuclease